MTPLALYIINTNTPTCAYQRRCDIARRPTSTITAASWTKVVVDGIREYEREIAPNIVVSTGSRLRLAAELADYYEKHIAEERDANDQAREDQNQRIRDEHGAAIARREKANSAW